MKDESENPPSPPIQPSSLPQAQDKPWIVHRAPSRVRYGVMGFLCILSFLTYYDRTCISSISGMIQSDLQLDNLQMGAVFSAFWLAYALLEIPSGFLGDRYGARGTLARIVLAWSAFTALSGSATGFVSLLTYRFLFGVGEAGAYPNMARIQSAWLPVSSRARAGGLLWLTARWGAAFAPFIFGWLMQLFGGDRFHHLLAGTAFAHSAPWRLSFYASGLLGVIWVALFWLWFRDNPAEQRGVNEGELELIRAGTPAASPGSADAPVPGMFASLFSSPSLWALAFLYTCVSFGWSFFVSWMPTFFRSVQGVSMVDSRWMTALPFFFGGISCLAGGALSDWVIQTTGNKRFGRAIFPVIGYTLAAGAMLGVRFTHTPWQATALFCVAAAALDLGQGANWASIVDIGGRYAGSATGFVNMIGNIGGNALQPVLGAWIFTHLGWNALFITYAGTSLAAAGMWFFINPNRRFYREAQPPGQGFEVIMDR